MHTIAVDCGASYIKAAVFRDGEKSVEKKVQTPVRPTVFFGSTAFIDETVRIVRGLVEELMGDFESIRLCMSNEMHGFLLCTEEGKPVTDYVSWQVDLSGNALSKESIPEDAILRTGMKLRGGMPSNNLYYAIKESKLPEGRLCFCTLGDFIIWRLSGVCPYTHPTNAAATGLFDLEKGEWSSELIHFIGAEDISFPKVGENVIYFHMNDTQVQALPAVGDQQAALLGSGLEGERTLSFNLGTGAQVTRLSEKICFDECWQVRPYFDGRYLLTIPHIPSGRAVNVYYRFIESFFGFFDLEEDTDEIWRRMTSVFVADGASGLVLDLGFFENAVSDSVKGSISEITEDNFTIEGLLSTLIRTIADNSVIIADRLWKDPENVEKLMFSGGIAERFPQIRARIQEHFANAEVCEAKGDTLEGLFLYGMRAEND